MPGGPADRPWPILQDYPAAMAEIGDRWSKPIWAIGDLADDGSIQSLTQWNHDNGMIAFTGSTPDCKPKGYSGGNSMKVTVGGILDWSFRRSAYLLFDGRTWVDLQIWPVFESEMYRIRKWGASRYSADEAAGRIADTIKLAVQRYDLMAADHA